MLVGCTMGNSPTSRVEDLFTKYQKLDEDISMGIDNVVNQQDLTKDHKERYRKLLERQYKNLSYEIKDELIDGDNATVLVEIEVVDYKKAISDLTFDSDNYTKESLEKELSYELVKATPSIFSLEGQGQILPKDNPPTGIEAILEKYK